MEDRRHPSRRRVLLAVLAVVLASVLILAVLGTIKLGTQPAPNRAPLASFTVSPSSGDTSTLFRFNASASSDPEDTSSDLGVRWDWEDDRAWDTEWSDGRIATHTFAASGTYVVRLEVRDTGGLTNATTRSVAVSPRDDVPPTVTIVLPGEGDNVFEVPVQVAGTADDNVAVVSVEVSADGLTWVPASGTTSWSHTVDLSPGVRTIRARAMDAAGNVGSDLVNVIVADTTAPTVEITYPTEGTLLTVAEIMMTGTAEDDVAVSLVEVSLDGSTWTNATGTTSWSAGVTLANGTNTVRARTTDSSGNMGHATANVTLIPPPELRLGVILSLTGPLEIFGDSAERAVRMAVEEVNAQGGVFGRSIKVALEDDQSSSEMAASAANQLIDWGADAIVGTLASSGCLPILDAAKANGVFHISGACPSPIFSDPALTEGWFARTNPSDVLQGAVGAYHAYHARGLRSVAVMASNHAYGRAVGNAFTENFTRHGGTITILWIMPEYAFDYTVDLSNVMATNPEAIYLTAFTYDATTLLRNWHANGAWSGVAWLFADGVLSQPFIDDLIASGIPPSVVQTFQGTALGAYLDLWGARHAAWSAAYEARWGLLPGIYDAQFYDAVYLVALAAEASGVDSGDGVRSRLWIAARPPGVEVEPGEWSEALAVLSGGGDVDYNGSANFADLMLNGDVTGPVVIWGIDASNRIIVNVAHDEAAVRAMLP